ncbi:MAG: Rv3235 family protein [Candidatus Nanopelagicales bacterium]
MSVTAAEQTLPLEWQVPGGLPATPPPARHLRLVTPLEPDDHDADGSAGASARPGGLPAPAPWVARLAPAIIEGAAGERPAGQLTRWVTRDIRETLARRGAAALRHPAGKDRPPQCRRVRSVRVTSPAPGIIEASAVVIGSVRARAVALRLEAVRGRWLATAVELG